MSLEEIAYGYIKVANEAMCRPIRNLTESRGYDTSKHILACFGAAAGQLFSISYFYSIEHSIFLGQHGCAIAKSLGIKSVYISRFAGILSGI